ncbi:MAG: Nif3-like dinuclear metal center hexameric protein [Opitutales bacterium]
MADLHDVVSWCDERTRRKAIRDFPGAENGLQFENSGKVTRIGAAVDGGMPSFRDAAAAGVDFLIVHHGMLWRPPVPVVGPMRTKLGLLFEHDLALYGSHLPLDCHPEIGNNALLAQALGLAVDGWWLEYEGTAIAAWADPKGVSRNELEDRLRQLFPETFISIPGGPELPRRIGILTGSGQSAVSRMAAEGIDTLITGELKQDHYTYALEHGLNLLLAGHYATETFGVRALAEECAGHFGLPWTFLDQPCPL